MGLFDIGTMTCIPVVPVMIQIVRTHMCLNFNPALGIFRLIKLLRRKQQLCLSASLAKQPRPELAATSQWGTFRTLLAQSLLPTSSLTNWRIVAQMRAAKKKKKKLK